MKNIRNDIEREKKNIFLCMHPAATVVGVLFFKTFIFTRNTISMQFQEQERALYQLLDKEENPDDLQNQMGKDFSERRRLRPIRLDGHYDTLNSNGTWQKY